MNDFLIFADLDGTLIRSAKKRAENDLVVEYKEKEPITCISESAPQKFRLFKNVIPVTTRSIEQYLRINIPFFSPKRAICSNGGNLLVNGLPDKDWFNVSLSAFESSRNALEECFGIFEADENRDFEIRLVDKLFLFTKSRCPEKTLAMTSGLCDKLNCFSVGAKVYAFPRSLDKGNAVKRFIKLENFSGTVICAGDSLPDIPMLNTADIAIFPEELNSDNKISAEKKLCAPRENFCDFVLEKIAEICRNTGNF